MAIGDSPLYGGSDHCAAEAPGRSGKNIRDETSALKAGCDFCHWFVGYASVTPPEGSPKSVAPIEHCGGNDACSAGGVGVSFDGSTETQVRPKLNGVHRDTSPPVREEIETEIHRTHVGDHMSIHLNMTNNVLDSIESPPSEDQQSTTIVIHKVDGESRDRRYARLEGKRERLRALRLQVLKTRGLAAERRNELAELRLAISSADGEFMKCVREQRVNAFSVRNEALLENLFQGLQDTRNRYGILEDEYNTLEDHLDAEEYEVAQLEEYFSKHNSSLQQITPFDDVTSPSESDDTEDFDIGFKTHHSLEDEFLSRLGDQDLCKEAHDKLVAKHERLLYSKKQRERLGKCLSPEDEAILAELPSKMTEMQEELAVIEADVERLRAECIELGLLEGWENDAEILESPGSVDIEQAEYNRYPLLLHKPRDDEKTFQSLISDFAEGDPGDRITRWLLHKLKSSCSEVELYARVSGDMGTRSDGKEWQKKVLWHWFRDSAIKPASYFQAAHTQFAHTVTTIIASPQVQDPMTIVPNPEGILPLSLLKYSSALYQRLEFGLLLKVRNVRGGSVRSV